MNINVLIYIVMILLSIYALSGLNIDHLFKKNHIIEAKLLIMIIGIIMGYLLSNFFIDFIEISKIL